MPKAGDVIENPITGQRVRFYQTAHDTNGAFVHVEYFTRPFAGKSAVPAHFHPAMTERFEIVRGTAAYRVGKAQREARPGTVLTFPPRVPHLHPWSISGDELHVRQTSIPDQPDIAALEALTEAVVTLFGLARDGKVNRDGLPNLLQLGVLVRSLMPHAYLEGMPVPVQESLFSVLAALGRLAGYQASYPHYRDT